MTFFKLWAIPRTEENKEEGNVVFHSFTQDTSGKLLCLENETIDINLEESTLLEIQKEKQEK